MLLNDRNEVNEAIDQLLEENLLLLQDGDYLINRDYVAIEGFQHNHS